MHAHATDPGPYPDSAPPRPPRPWRGSPWTAPAPSPPSRGASSSCWSRSGLPRKTRALSSSELRQIASSHSFLSRIQPAEVRERGGEDNNNKKKTRTLSPSVRPTPRSTNYYTTTTKKCTRQCFLFFTARRAKKKNPSPSVHKVYNPNCDLETPRRTCGGRLCHPRAPARVRSSP